MSRVMKRPLAWFERNLHNGQASLVEYQKQLAALYQRAQSCREHNEKTERVLAQARAKGLTEMPVID